jgi:DNA primase
MTTAAGKRRFTTEGLAVVAALPDRVEQEHYLNQIARMTDTSLEAVQAKLDTASRPTSTPLKSVKPTTAVLAAPERPKAAHQDNLLAVLMAHPGTRHHLGDFDTAMFAGEERQVIAAWLKKHDGPLDEMPVELKPLETYVKIIQLKAESRYEGWSEQDSSLEVAKLLRQTEVEHKKQTKERLINDLRDAESAGDDQAAEALRTQLFALIKETA